MTPAGARAPLAEPFGDVLLAARLIAIDPRLGGMVLAGEPEPIAGVVGAISACLPAGAPVRRIPTNVDADRLIGGIDLGMTLALGRPVAQRGLLAEADEGVVVLPMAERAAEGTVSAIADCLDQGEVLVAREGALRRDPARFVLVAIDSSCEGEGVAPTISDRLAFRFDLSGIRPERLADMGGPDVADHPHTAFPASLYEALAGVAEALGVAGLRALIHAARVAQAAARLAARETVSEADLETAIRLVLLPRATRLPAPEVEAEPPPSEPNPPETRSQDDPASGEVEQVADRVLDAVLASLPPDMLAALAQRSGRGPAPRGRGAGERRRSRLRGRPVGTRAGVPRAGLRLALIDTIRAAAPWQRLRGRDDARVRIRKDDLRIRRFEARAEAVTIFAVDASGSSALARLAEAKGAVELLLGEAYVKRAQVALVAFRGTGAELLLPPTRSLARARRALAELPGGGGTPIAAGLDAARGLAEAALARGRTPFVVVLSDGRANVTRDGSGDRLTAQSEAEVAARSIAQADISAVFVDISPRPRPEGALLAAAMRARYLPLPRADAVTMHQAVKAMSQ